MVMCRDVCCVTDWRQLYNCTPPHRRSVAVPVVYSGGHAPLLKSPPDNCYASILPLLFTTTASKYHILLPVMQSHYSITFLKTDS